MEKISKTVKNPFVLAIALNLIPLLLLVVLGSCRFASMDDFFMSSILSGAYGSVHDVHLYFVNAVFGYFLKPFYGILPSVGWYYIFEIAEVFASFIAITYILLTRLGLKNGIRLSVLFLACLSPLFYFEMEFTKNAALLTATGMLLLSLGNSKKRKYLVLGVLFAVAGFVMRKDAFYLGLPCFGMLLCFKGLYLKKIPLINIIAALSCAVVVAGVSSFNKSLYQDGEYRYYAEYQGPRAVFGDGRYYDFDAALDEIEERGLHGIDFKLLTDWTYYDTDVLAKDSLQKFIGIINHNRHEVILSKMPMAVIQELSRCLHEVNVWLWIALSIALICLSVRQNRFVPWVSFGYVVAAYSYLLLLNRVAPHVEASIWLYGSVVLIPFFDRKRLDDFCLSKSMSRLLYVSSVLLYAMGFWNSPNSMKAPMFQSPQDNRWNAFMQYERDNVDKLFFMDLTAYKRFCSRLGGSYRALEPGRLNHIIPLGYWNVHLPSIKKELHKRGIENPFKAFTNSDVLVVNYGKSGLYEEFLELHYDYDVEWKNLLWSNVPGREFLSFDVTKFYLQEEQHEK